MIAGGMMLFVALVLMQLIGISNQDTAESNRANEGWLEATSASRELQLSLNNVIRLDPMESLAPAPPGGAAKGVYPGITALEKKDMPAECRKDGEFTALRMTSIVPKRQPEKLLRKWSSASAGKTGRAHELRLSLKMGASIFSMAKPPREITLIDVDGKFKRRYRVKKFDNRKTNLHPYDDLPKKGPDGKDIIFEYTAVLLDEPLLPNSTYTVSPPDPAVTFLVNSMMYHTNTTVVCVSRDSGDLLEISDRSSRGLISRGGKLTSILKFKVDFANTQKKGRVDQLEFKPSLDDFPDRECVDMARFAFDLSVRDPRKPGGPHASVQISRNIVVPNLHGKRPPACFASAGP